MQLADEDQSDAVRRADDYATAWSGPTRQSGSTGLRVQCKSTRRSMCRVFIILTSRSFFLGKPSQYSLGAKPIQIEEHWRFFLVTILLAKIVTGFESE